MTSHFDSPPEAVWAEQLPFFQAQIPVIAGLVNLDAIGDDALLSVGAYQLEGRGAQLFSAVRGDFFTILGMPLLPLLEFLRGQGVLPR